MRLVLTSDTHTKENLLELPDGDVLIHCGDFDLRHLVDINALEDWFSNLPHKHKLWIAGNHDFYPEGFSKEIFKIMVNFSTYLQDDEVVIEGIKFYGFPWTPIFNDWSFMLNESRMKEKVKEIPKDTDVLISHGPCYGILDQLRKANGTFGESVGSIPLRDRVKEIKPSIHVFGHIHEGYGKYTDYKTNYFNVSHMDEFYQPTNKPMVVDIFKLSDGTVEVIA